MTTLSSANLFSDCVIEELNAPMVLLVVLVCSVQLLLSPTQL
jgi:hypothetical protein